MFMFVNNKWLKCESDRVGVIFVSKIYLPCFVVFVWTCLDCISLDCLKEQVLVGVFDKHGNWESEAFCFKHSHQICGH